MADRPLANRLLIKPGHTVRTYNAPSNYTDLLGELPENVQMADSGSGPFDVVHLFAKDSGVLNRDAPDAMKTVKPGGLLWMSYPKRSSKVDTDLTRDKGWEVVQSAGWRGIAQVSVDEVWSATRFRPESEVGT